MATLTVWKFDDPLRAEQVRAQVIELQKKQLITVHDAVVVSWPEDKKKPRTQQAFSPTGAGASGGAFWGLLFGIIFFVPLFGMAFGAAMGALAGSMRDFGISDEFIETVREKVTPGTSALFLMSSGGVRDRIAQELGDHQGELIATNLSVDDEAAVRDMFGSEEQSADQGDRA